MTEYFGAAYFTHDNIGLILYGYFNLKAHVYNHFLIAPPEVKPILKFDYRLQQQRERY